MILSSQTSNKALNPAIASANSIVAEALRRDVAEVERELPDALAAVERARADQREVARATFTVRAQSAGDMAPGADVIEQRKAASAASLRAQRAIAHAVIRVNQLRARKLESEIRLRRIAQGQSFELPSDRSVLIAGNGLIGMPPAEVIARTAQNDREREEVARQTTAEAELERLRQAEWADRGPGGRSVRARRQAAQGGNDAA